MELTDLEKRLGPLLSRGIITENSFNIAVVAFENIQKKLNKIDIEQSEMLFTHLPMAITRMENKEVVAKGPSKEMLSEIHKSKYFPLVVEQVDFLEQVIGESLPKSEREYLYLHFTNIFNINLEGEK